MKSPPGFRGRAVLLHRRRGTESRLFTVGRKPWSYAYGTRDGGRMVATNVNGDWAGGGRQDPIGIFTEVLQGGSPAGAEHVEQGHLLLAGHEEPVVVLHGDP